MCMLVPAVVKAVVKEASQQEATLMVQIWKEVLLVFCPSVFPFWVEPSFSRIFIWWGIGYSFRRIDEPILCKVYHLLLLLALLNMDLFYPFLKNQILVILIVWNVYIINCIMVPSTRWRIRLALYFICMHRAGKPWLSLCVQVFWRVEAKGARNRIAPRGSTSNVENRVLTPYLSLLCILLVWGRIISCL